jgi:hypothetical protein
MTTGHVRPHLYDVFLLVLVGLTLAAVAAFLGAGGAGTVEGSGGWRRVDTQAVRVRVESGQLSGREADWWHPVGEGGGRASTPDGRR